MKPNIDAPLVQRLIREQFPQWAGLPVRPVEHGGCDNRTFHLGEVMSVRLPSSVQYAPQVEKEQRWLPRLAPLLPLPIPVPIALGKPSGAYPWPWSVYRWLDGEHATSERISDPIKFALALAQFLAALQRIDPADGPPAGPHNFYRGGPLSTYDAETRQSIVALKGRIDTAQATAVWDTALEVSWRGAPVWLHGDVSAGNLLVSAGRLSAVIDFGCSGVGDPACDLTIAWTFLSGPARRAFRSALPMDDGTWARARGWALWKALITLGWQLDSNPVDTEKSKRLIDDILADALTA